MMEKVQRFGGAMFTPVLLFSFSGIMVALCIIFKNPMLVGSIATEGSTWFNIWTIIENGSWTVFNQMELLFVLTWVARGFVLYNKNKKVKTCSTRNP